MIPANFNQLYYFWRVAKAGSITAAAKSLLLNQSTLSLQMKQLERSLGRTLLARGRGGVTLTEAGRLAFEHCERIFAHAEEMLALLREERPSAAAVFRLGVCESVPRGRILELVDRLKALDRGVSVRIYTSASDDLETRLERRLLDLVLSDIDLGGRLGAGYYSRQLPGAPLHFVAVPALKKRMGAFPAGLSRIPLILRPPSDPVRKDAEHFLRRNRVTPDVHAVIDDPELIRLMTVRGEGASLLSPDSVREKLRGGRLCLLHKKPIGIKENAWLLCARARSARPRVQRLLDASMRRGAA